MPTSRGRKKKPKNKAKNANNKTFESDGIKISQKGNMTYVQNKRSQIEHKQFVNHVIENRPLFYEEIKSDINKNLFKNG